MINGFNYFLLGNHFLALTLDLSWKTEGCPAPKLNGTIILDSYIREQNMNKKDHFSAPSQAMSAENMKAVELKVNHLAEKTFSFPNIWLVIPNGAKFMPEVD